MAGTVAIHQPNYIPWAGYFHKMAACDTFVFLDDVQYTKNGFINRNRIKTAQGVQWLTVPVHASVERSILETGCVKGIWPEKQLKTLKLAYSKASFYNQVMEWFAPLLSHAEETESIADLNIRILTAFAGEIRMGCRLVKASELQVEKSGDERLVEIVKSLDGDRYLSGQGGKKYQDVGRFADHGITLAYDDFKHPQYRQLWGDFTPNLSILDMLFNCGFEEIRELIGA